MSEQFHPVIQGLLSKNSLATLKFIEKHDTSLFKEQINNVVNKKSFFLHLIDENPFDNQYGLDLYHLCERNGYDVTKRISDLSDHIDNDFAESKNFSFKNEEYIQLEQRKKRIIPDILKILIRNNEDLSIHLIEKLGKNYFLELEKEDCPVLPMLYNTKKPNLKIIKMISEFGLDYNKIYEGYKSYEKMVENNAELLSYYFSLPSDNKEQKIETAFKKDKEYVDIKVRNMTNTKEEFKTPELINYLSLRLPFMEQSKQEELISDLYPATDIKVIKESLKLIGKNLKTYSPVYEPIWKNITKIENHNLFLSILERNIPLDSYDKERDTYYIKELAKTVVSLDIDFGVKTHSEANSNKALRDKKLINSLREVISSEILFSNVVGKNHTWFSELCKPTEITAKNKKDKYKIILISEINNISNISPESKIFNPSYESPIVLNGTISLPENKITDKEWDNNYIEGENNYTVQQRLVIRELLDKTLFNKNESGVLAIENIFQHRSYFLNHTFINNKKLWEQDLVEPIFNKEEKLLIYQNFFKYDISSFGAQSEDNIANYLLKNLMEDSSIMIQDIEVNNPILEKGGYKASKEKYMELYTQKHFEYLDNKIKNKTNVIIARKKI